MGFFLTFTASCTMKCLLSTPNFLRRRKGTDGFYRLLNVGVKWIWVFVVINFYLLMFSLIRLEILYDVIIPLNCHSGYFCSWKCFILSAIGSRHMYTGVAMPGTVLWRYPYQTICKWRNCLSPWKSTTLFFTAIKCSVWQGNFCWQLSSNREL